MGDDDNLVVELGLRGGKATIPPSLFKHVGPYLKWCVVLFSIAGSVAMILAAYSLVVRASR